MRTPFIIVLVVCAFGWLNPSAAGSENAGIEATRTSFDKWVELQETVARDQRDWAVEKEFLAEEIRLLREEIAALKEKSARLSETTAKTEAEVAKAEAETKSLKEASALVVAELPKVEAELRRLAAYFPAPLLEQVEPLMNRLPRDAANVKAGPAERLQTVVGLMSQVDRFNGSFTVASELRKSPAGTEVQVRTLYLGLAQAWFVSPDRKFAGFGKPGGSGWEWTPANELANAIERGIAVQENTGAAEYVALPVSIK